MSTDAAPSPIRPTTRKQVPGPEGARTLSLANGRGGRPATRETLVALLAVMSLVIPFVGFLHDVWIAGQVRDLAWERVQKTRTLRVGMDFGVPPFAVPGNSDVQGYDADLARDLGMRLGLAVTIVNTPSDALYDALLTGKVDALIAALPVTPEFRRDVAYSAPYVEMGERAVVRVGSTISRPADLAARYLARSTPMDLRSIYDSSDAALADLRSGTLDAVILDGIAARRAVTADRALVIVDEPVLSNGYVIATKQDAPTLTAHLQDALAAARAAGVLSRLETRWLDNAE